jgi:hypothetical protein
MRCVSLADKRSMIVQFRRRRSENDKKGSRLAPLFA